MNRNRLHKGTPEERRGPKKKTDSGPLWKSVNPGMVPGEESITVPTENLKEQYSYEGSGNDETSEDDDSEVGSEDDEVYSKNEDLEEGTRERQGRQGRQKGRQGRTSRRGRKGQFKWCI
ncbi:hypothetical protein CDD81_1449 [Ophiocordyceps australis]|uniref:Uncharacterized protein n=1 Tax=Ophiocordyceps australis TaxID=1399860 RepID=A0A2C5YEL0_9HYPO|nr:hypothetical protein CDD81_1449 [Ophiocordyceps australis]